jgi:hypothetical protein
MSDPIKAVATGAVNDLVAQAFTSPALKPLHQIDAVLAEANAKQGVQVKPKAPSEFVILVRHPKNRTLHAVYNQKGQPGVIAVFESSELAAVQASTIPACQNREYYIIPVE